MEGWTLEELAAQIGGTLNGPPSQRVVRPVPAGSSDPQGITFSTGPKYDVLVNGSGVGVVLVGSASEAQGVPTILVSEPRAAFGYVLAACRREIPLDSGIHPTALVHESAAVNETANIGAYAVIERGAVIGHGAKVHPFCYVGENCNLGENVILYPHCVLYQDIEIGAGSIIHAGTVLGNDGFGYVWTGKLHQKIPQVGGVRIGAGVEIGSNTCIDRATCGDTEIDDGCKIDNLVQVGHNVKIGEHSVIAGQTGVAGSVVIGKRVIVGGQVAFNDHVTVGDDISLAGRSGVFKDVFEPGEYYGLPATPVKKAMRRLAAERKLPELVERIRALEEQVAKLTR